MRSFSLLFFWANADTAEWDDSDEMWVAVGAQVQQPFLIINFLIPSCDNANDIVAAATDNEFSNFSFSLSTLEEKN